MIAASPLHGSAVMHLDHDGRSKRWVVVRPPGAQTGVLLARADGESQSQSPVVGKQVAGRVGFFLRAKTKCAAPHRQSR